MAHHRQWPASLFRLFHQREIIDFQFCDLLKTSLRGVQTEAVSQFCLRLIRFHAFYCWVISFEQTEGV